MESFLNFSNSLNEGNYLRRQEIPLFSGLYLKQFQEIWHCRVRQIKRTIGGRIHNNLILPLIADIVTLHGLCDLLSHSVGSVVNVIIILIHLRDTGALECNCAL